MKYGINMNNLLAYRKMAGEFSETLYKREKK